ncbi:MAG: hypothetical protein RL326_1858 [Pseudomonadota bacterium]|jgi:hypothetical protein
MMGIMGGRILQDDEDDTERDLAPERSAIAREVEDLQKTVLRLARDRERLPQPLFWSLFNTRLRDIKKHKDLARLLKETLGESE